MAGTPGAAFPDALPLPSGVRRLFVGGLATDYCVRASVLDALALGYAVVVLRGGVAAVDVQPGDGERARAAMQQRGAIVAAAADALP